MSKNRIKVNLPEVTTRSEAARIAYNVACDVNEQRRISAAMDKELLAIKKSYAARLGTLEKEIEGGTAALLSWAEANPGEFPKGKKSIDFGQAVVGFRTGTPKLVLLSRAWTWDKVLAAVRQFLPAFIRDKPEVDKEALIAQRDEEALKWALPKVGLKVAQAETFYVEPSLTEVETRQTATSEAA